MWAVASSMWAVAASIYDAYAACGLLQPLCGLLHAPCGLFRSLWMLHMRYVGCYSLYIRCTGAMWDVTFSMDDAQALCGLL